MAGVTVYHNPVADVDAAARRWRRPVRWARVMSSRVGPDGGQVDWPPVQTSWGGGLVRVALITRVPLLPQPPPARMW